MILDKELSPVPSQLAPRAGVASPRPRCRPGGPIAIVLALMVLLLPARPARAQSYPHMRYNQVRQKMIHNAMSTEEPILDMILYHDVRVFEFDTHNGKNTHGSLTCDWWLYHSGDLANENSEHSAETLSDALKEVQTFHLQNPQHEVFTFYIDAHDAFEPGRTPAELDALIDKYFPFDTNLAKSHSFTPFHMLHAGDPAINPVPQAGPCPCANGTDPWLVACVDGTYSPATYPACQWPLLASLRGKVLFVVTGGDSRADQYTRSGRDWLARRAFATYDHKTINSRHARTWDAAHKKWVIDNPQGYDLHPWEVIFNVYYSDSGNVFTTDCAKWPQDCHKPLQAILNEKHLVGRSFGTNSEGDWNTQKNLRVQIIGTDRVNESAYPYATTHGEQGFPFQCALTSGDACGTEVESRGSPVFNFTVSTEDINNGSDADSMAFAERQDAADKDWSVQVSVPSSWVADWAKGCLMARQDRANRAAYFAVCRTANTERLQVQWRSDGGGKAEAAGYDDDSDVDAQLFPAVRSMSKENSAYNGVPKHESPSFVKMVSAAKSTKFTAFGSRDGSHWYQIGKTRTFKHPLVFKGIAATAHGQNKILLRFQQFSVNGKFQNAADGSWDYWLIGDKGSLHAACTPSGCAFPVGSAGNARFFLFRSGWGHD